jgi:hypothetical protein
MDKMMRQNKDWSERSGSIMLGFAPAVKPSMIEALPRFIV